MTSRITFIQILFSLALNSSLYAFLGGFEQTDGYRGALGQGGPDNRGGLQWYNGGTDLSTTYASPSTTGNPQGSWIRLGDPSSFSFDLSAGAGNGTSSYATAHAGYDRAQVNSNISNGSNQALVLTTENRGWSGSPLIYRYNLDSADLGQSPAATSNSIVHISFWWCASLPGASDGTGLLADGYFGNSIEFKDSAGNVGFTLGLTQRGSYSWDGGLNVHDDKVTYWDGNALVESTIKAPSNSYDRWDITIDLEQDTFSADYYKFYKNTQTGINYSLVTDAQLQNEMFDLSTLEFQTSPGVIHSKMMSVDDFSFNVAPVPEPSGLILVSLAGTILLRRKRN